jgi:DNA-binding NtrC family response regulator
MHPDASSPDPSNEEGHILFVDDDEDVLKAATLELTRHGLRVSTARAPGEAWSVLAADRVDVVLLDLNFSRGATTGEEGFQCLTEIVAQDPDAVVVVVTGHSGVNIAVAAMRAGASDFVMKPWRNDRLVATLRAAVELRRRRREGAALKARGAGQSAEALDGGALILGDSPAIQRVRATIRRAAPTDASVLIYGEAGTGKSLMARAIHLQSPRATGSFVPVDLAGLADEAATLALFGGPEGGGAFEEARAGTIFLDEVGALPPRPRARLLAAIEEGRIVRPGGTSPIPIDVRIVAATRRPREALRGVGGLGDDLFFRLNTVEILAPPLRDRGGDVLILAEHFLRLFAQRYGRPVKQLSPEAADAVADHAWPGDVRALRQAMERCVIFADGGRYELDDVAPADAAEPGAAPARPGLDLAASERALIARALKSNAFNVSHAARQLGLTRAALYRRMAKHGL